MYKCLDCERIIEELGTHRESRGECHGISSHEIMDNHCECGGDFEEAAFGNILSR